MATRYWVGGAGTWDNVNTANWSATSGGAGGASVPTNTDDVVFNSSSGSGYVYADPSYATCLTLTITSSPSLYGIDGSIAIYGNATRSNGSCSTSGLTLVYWASGTFSWGSDGFYLGGLVTTGLGPTPTITVGANNIYVREVNISTACTLNLNGKLLTTNKLYSDATLTNGTIEFRGYNATYYTLTLGANSVWSSAPLTIVNASYTPTINIVTTNPANVGNVTFNASGGYTVTNLNTKNLTFNSGTITVNGSMEVYGTFYLDASATLTAPSGTTVTFGKISGSPTSTRNIQIYGALSGSSGKVAITVNAGADTMNFSTSYGSSIGTSSGRLGTILIYSPVTFSAVAGTLYANGFAVSGASATCDFGALSQVWTGGFAVVSSATVYNTGSLSINFKDYTALGYCTFTAGSATYSVVTLVDAVPLEFTGAATIGTLNCVSSLGQGNTKALKFDGGYTYTINTAFNLTGASGADQVTLTVKSGTTPATLSKSSGTVTADYATISYSTATGGATFNAPAPNNINGGHNSGWSFGGSTGSSNFFTFF